MTVNDSNLDGVGALCENLGMDWELILAIGFVLFGSLGLMCGGLAGYYYSQGEPSNDAPRVLVAIVAFVLQYGLIFLLTTALRRDDLIPIIVMFLAAMALIIAIRLGLQAHSKSGTRIALAALFTLGAYMCRLSNDYLKFSKLYR